MKTNFLLQSLNEFHIDDVNVPSPEERGFHASDMWRYYCLHLKRKQLGDWIEAQYPTRRSSMELVQWPFTEPITDDMVAELHKCPTRMADQLLDVLARSVRVGQGLRGLVGEYTRQGMVVDCAGEQGRRERAGKMVTKRMSWKWSNLQYTLFCFIEL